MTFARALVCPGGLQSGCLRLLLMGDVCLWFGVQLVALVIIGDCMQTKKSREINRGSIDAMWID